MRSKLWSKVWNEERPCTGFNDIRAKISKITSSGMLGACRAISKGTGFPDVKTVIAVRWTDVTFYFILRRMSTAVGGNGRTAETARANIQFSYHRSMDLPERG